MIMIWLMKKILHTWDAQKGLDTGIKPNIWGILSGAGFFPSTDSS